MQTRLLGKRCRFTIESYDANKDGYVRTEIDGTIEAINERFVALVLCKGQFHTCVLDVDTPTGRGPKVEP